MSTLVGNTLRRIKKWEDGVVPLESYPQLVGEAVPITPSTLDVIKPAVGIPFLWCSGDEGDMPGMHIRGEDGLVYELAHYYKTFGRRKPKK